jgi:vacuolar-type H+-ATPase subunit C/Vma6
MELLRDIAADGFPTDYLLARIRGRRVALISDWRAVRARGLAAGTTDERIWEALLAELEWLYGQMNRALRQRLAPVFVLFELKTIVLCVRSKAAHRTSELDRLLARSLLAAPVQQALRHEPDVRSTVATVTEIVARDAAPVREAASAYASDGLRGFEDGLMRGYLAHAAAAPLHPVVRRFFAAFVDLRNIMILYKQLRWGVADAAAFIPGGALEPARFERALAHKDLAAVDGLVEQATGLEALPAAASEGALETALLASLTRQLRQAGRASEDIGLILDYLWRHYVQARNLAVLLHGGTLDAGTLERELIA